MEFNEKKQLINNWFKTIQNRLFTHFKGETI